MLIPWPMVEARMSPRAVRTWVVLVRRGYRSRVASMVSLRAGRMVAELARSPLAGLVGHGPPDRGPVLIRLRLIISLYRNFTFAAFAELGIGGDPG